MPQETDELLRQIVDDFFHESQRPGSDAQKQLANLEAQINDERLFMFALTELLTQLAIKQKELERLFELEQTAILADRSEKARLERIYQLQKEIIEAQMKAVEEKCFGKPLSVLEEMRDDLQAKLNKVTAQVAAAQQTVQQTTVAFQAQGKKMDASRQKSIQAAQSQVSPAHYAAATRALANAPSSSKMVEMTQGQNLSAVRIITNDVMRVLIEPTNVPQKDEEVAKKQPPKEQTKEWFEDPDEIEYEDEDEDVVYRDPVAVLMGNFAKRNPIVTAMISEQAVTQVEEAKIELLKTYQADFKAKMNLLKMQAEEKGLSTGLDKINGMIENQAHPHHHKKQQSAES